MIGKHLIFFLIIRGFVEVETDHHVSCYPIYSPGTLRASQVLAFCLVMQIPSLSTG